jgi:flavodoxin
MKRAALFLCSIFCVLACAGAPATRDAAAEAQQDNATKPIVLYYSRLGHAEMVAKALSNQLGCDMEKIASKKDRGMLTLMAEQTFNLSDDQDAPPKDPAGYNPIIVVSPIYFMRLSAPARTLIEKYIPKGKRVYVFTTSGGPLAGFTGRSIKKLAEESGLIVQTVHGFQIGKKTQGDFDAEIKTFLEKTPVR